MIYTPETSALEDAAGLLDYDRGLEEEAKRRLGPVEFHGAAAWYHRCSDKEVVLDSGAGTGKTFSWMWKAHWTAEQYAGCIQIMARQTRKSMSTTVLPDFERDVLGVPTHPAISGDATCDTRDKYRYPNGSEIWILGLENVDRILSSKIDRFYIAQAEEMPTPEPFEKLMSRLRNRKTPYHQGTLDVNPAGEFHWINSRPEEMVCVACLDADSDDPGALPDKVPLDPESGLCPRCGGSDGKPRMSRIEYRPRDNPTLWDPRTQSWTPWGREYCGVILGSLTGVDRKRLKLHQWVSEEGQIFEEYDSAIHRLVGEVQYDSVQNTHWLTVKNDRRFKERRELTWFSGSMDFGYRKPGCLQVWGHDREDRRYMVAEVYKRGQRLDLWAGWIAELYQEFPMRRIIADSADGGTGACEQLNTRLSARCGRSVGRIVTPAEKGRGKLEMLDLVRDSLEVDSDGEPSTYFLADALRFGRDEGLAREHQPCSTLQEIRSYVWFKSADGRPIKEKPDPGCADHGMDAMQYEHRWDWGRDLTPRKPRGAFRPGTWGFLARHEEVFGRKRQRLYEHDQADPARLDHSPPARQSRPNPRRHRAF